MAQDDGIIIRQLLPSDSMIELTDLLHRAYARLADMGLRYRATHRSVEVTRERVMGWTPPGGIDVPKWRCEHTT